MKQKRYILWPALVVPALCAFTARATEVRLAPAEGLTLAKTYENSSNLSLEDYSMSMNGNAMEMDMEMTTTAKYRLAVTDTYEAVADGRPTKLRRTFDEIASSSSSTTSFAVMGNSQEANSSATGESELEGKTVVFTGSDGGYDVAFAEDVTGDADLLEDLDHDLDFAALLPDGEVEKGGEPWSIDPEAFRSLFVPGGALKIDSEVEGGEGMGMGNTPEPSPDQLFGEFEGEATGQLVDVVEEGGLRLAVIRLQLEVSSAKDLTDLMKEMLADADMGDMPMEMEVQSFDAEFTFTGEGELRWNLEAGVLHSLDLTGDVEQVMDTAMSMSMQGQEMDVENSMGLSGSSSITIDVAIEG